MVARPARRNKGEREIPTESRLGQASLRPVAAAQHGPSQLGQHVGDLLQQPVGLLQAAGGFGAASRLAVSVLPLVVARREAEADAQWIAEEPIRRAQAEAAARDAAMEELRKQTRLLEQIKQQQRDLESQPPSSQFCVGHTLGMPEGFMAIDCM